MNPLATPTAPATPRRNISLRRHILIAISLLLLGVLVIIGAAIILFVLRTEEQSWESRQNERARAAAGRVTLFLQRTTDTLQFVAMVPPANLIAPAELLPRLLDDHPELLEIVRLDTGGGLVASAARGTPVLESLFTVAQSVWFQRALAGEVYFGDVQLSAQDEPYVIIAAPAAGAGVVAARLHLTVLEALVNDIELDSSGQTYVVNQAGQVIAHADRAVVLANTTLRGRPEIAQVSANEGRAGTRYINFQGQPVLGITVALPATNWLLINEVTQAEATAISRRALIIFGLGALLFGVVVELVIAGMLGRLIFRPIEQLRAGAARIEQGDRDHRLPETRRDEVGQVAQAFNTMAQAVQEREQELRTLADSLEQAVEARTAELRREADERARLQVETLRQAEAIRDMSTPVIPISAAILVMPLIGALDTQRVAQVLDTLLRAIERERAQAVILDVTGVPLIDTQVAAALIQASRAVRLLGARPILTGVRPEIAQTLVALGVDLRELVTRSTLQSGIEEALRAR